MKKININFLKNIKIKTQYLLIGGLFIYSISISLFSYKMYTENIKDKSIINKQILALENEKKKIDRTFFYNEIKLKNYSGVDFKITDEGTKIIENIRNLHKSPNIISEANSKKEICAGFIWILSEKLWGTQSPYYIGMMNRKTKTPAKARELPYFYTAFGGKDLIDLGNKFSINDKDFWLKITSDDIKSFFVQAFSEESLLGDIGFLYKNTNYASFLNGWSNNSHITKNMGISDFDIFIQKNYDNKSHLDIITDSFSCNKEIPKNYYDILNYYNFYLNGKRIILYNDYFYYIDEQNILGKKVNFKYLDKVSYKDITLVHFFEEKARVDSLFNFICKGEFFPINITSINPRFIEKK